MKQLLTIALVLASVFASTFFFIKATGILTLDDIKYWLGMASDINPAYVALIVIALLFSDLFIAVPTLTICLLSGYFLGWQYGGLTALTGMLLAVTTGYWISHHFGTRLLLKIYKDPQKIEEIRTLFSSYSGSVILMCRAAPMLPEVVSCLAGANRMFFAIFLKYHCISTIPYAFIAAYAGSRSTPMNPTPAILTAIGISLTLWVSWFIFLRNVQTKTKIIKSP